LEEDDIAGAFALGPAEEMVEADLKNLGAGGVAGDMTSEFAAARVRAHDHRQRVPANDRGDPRLRIEVPGKRALLFERNGVLIRAKGQQVGDDAEILGLPVKRRQNEFGPLASRHTKDRLERVEPLGCLGRIAIVWVVERWGRIDSLEHAAIPLPMDRVDRS
jgi:hypothetical protein